MEENNYGISLEDLEKRTENVGVDLKRKVANEMANQEKVQTKEEKGGR